MFILLLLVGILNYLATVNHLYWSINEFDSPVHFLGGATLSMSFLWLYFFSGLFNPQKRTLAKFLLVAMMGSMFVAVLWEVYEIVLGEAALGKAEYFYDTTLDFIMDMLGILAGSFYGYLRETKLYYAD